MKYFLFTNIAGCYPKWTVAVLAVSRADATRRINGPMWRGGRFAGELDSGKVTADCGDVTDAAQAVLHERLEEEYQHAKAVELHLTQILGREPTWKEMISAL